MEPAHKIGGPNDRKARDIWQLVEIYTFPAPKPDRPPALSPLATHVASELRIRPASAFRLVEEYRRSIYLRKAGGERF